MIHPLPSKAAPETRERWQKAAEENIRQGYYLEIDNANEEARWRHLWKAPLWQDWGRVADILEEYAPKHPNAFKLIRRERRADETAEATPVEIELPEPEPEPEPETENNQEEEAMPEQQKPVILTKPWYRSGDIKQIAGVSSTTLSRYRDQIEHRRVGDGPTSPVEYSARGLQAWLAGRGIEATIAPTATAWEGVQSAQKAAAKAPEPVKPAVEEQPETVSIPFEEVTPHVIGAILQPAIDAAYERAESSGDGEIEPPRYIHRPILTPAPNVLPWDELPQEEPEPAIESPTQRLVMAVRDLEAARDLGDAAQISEAERQFNRAIFQARREADRLKEQVRQIELAIKRTRRRMRVLKVFGL